MTGNIQEDRWIRYLLRDMRDMSEQEREKIEEMYVTNAERHEHLCAIEDELIVRYLDNRLPARDKRLFEAAYNATKAQRSKLADISQIHNWAKSSAGKPTKPRAARLTLGDILSFSLTPSYAVRGGKEAEHTPPPLVEVPRSAVEFGCSRCWCSLKATPPIAPSWKRGAPRSGMRPIFRLRPTRAAGV